jgi:hypothetical protein
LWWLVVAAGVHWWGLLFVVLALMQTIILGLMVWAFFNRDRLSLR